MHVTKLYNKKNGLSRLEGATRLRPIVLFKDWMVSNSPQGLLNDYSKRRKKKQPSFFRKKAALIPWSIPSVTLPRALKTDQSSNLVNVYVLP